MEVGPRSAMTYWQGRLAELLNISDSLRSKDFTVVFGVGSAARCKTYHEWKVMEAKVRSSGVLLCHQLLLSSAMT